MDFKGASEYIIQRLRSELSPALHYHCLAHTLDVAEATRRLIETEKITVEAGILVETAALFHDAGMIYQYADHESRSAEMAMQILPGFGYSKASLDEVSALIMSTRLPQQPHSLHEQVICDADLDYLGRSDFFINAFKLRLEWQVNGIRSTTLAEWLDIQVDFLGDHQYFTKSAVKLREATRKSNLAEIIHLLHKS